MIISPKRNCPHVSLIELYPLKKLKLQFDKLKCKYCI